MANTKIPNIVPDLTKHFYNYKGYRVFPRISQYDHYEQIGSSNKSIIRNSDVCIYCGSNFNDYKLNHAHLIPELFGQNKSHNKYECNQCNELSGKWETSLGTFTTPIRIVSKIKNKRGKIPKFKSRLDEYETQSIIYFDDNDVLKGHLATRDDFILDKETNKGKLKFRLGSFNPYDVYKAFLKVAISLMPDNILTHEKWMIEYLFKDKPDNKIFPIIYMIFMDDGVFKEPFFELRRYNGKFKYHPKYILDAYFGKAIIQIILPIDVPNENVFIQLPPITQIQSPRSEYQVEKVDLSSNNNEQRDWSFTLDFNTK